MFLSLFSLVPLVRNVLFQVCLFATLWCFKQKWRNQGILFHCMVLIYPFNRLQLGYWSIFPIHFLHLKTWRVAEALNQTSQKNLIFQCDFSFYCMSLYYLFSSMELFTLQYCLYTIKVTLCDFVIFIFYFWTTFMMIFGSLLEQFPFTFTEWRRVARTFCKVSTDEKKVNNCIFGWTIPMPW